MGARLQVTEHSVPQRQFLELWYDPPGADRSRAEDGTSLGWLRLALRDHQGRRESERKAHLRRRPCTPLRSCVEPLKPVGCSSWQPSCLVVGNGKFNRLRRSKRSPTATRVASESPGRTTRTLLSRIPRSPAIRSTAPAKLSRQNRPSTDRIRAALQHPLATVERIEHADSHDSRRR